MSTNAITLSAVTTAGGEVESPPVTTARVAVAPRPQSYSGNLSSKSNRSWARANRALAGGTESMSQAGF